MAAPVPQQNAGTVVMNPVTNPPVVNPPVTNPDPANPDDKPGHGSELPTELDFDIKVTDTSYKYGGSAESFYTTWSLYTGDWWWDNTVGNGPNPDVPMIEVELHAVNAVGLRMVFTEYEFDSTKIYPEYSAAGPALGENVLVSIPHYFKHGATDTVQFAVMQFHPQDQPGFTGADGVVAKYYFVEGNPPGGFTSPPWQDPVVPSDPPCAASLTYDATAGALKWGYQLPGDFDQNGYVDLNDWSVLVANFNDPVTSLDSIEGVIHNAGTGNAQLQDISIWGPHINYSIASYNVYAGAAADYPEGGTLLGSVAQTAGTGDPAAARLQYSFALPSAGAGQHYWVRPVAGGAEGIPSNDLTF